MDEQRQRRLALNEARFREVNDSLKDNIDTFRGGAVKPETYLLLCECALETCEEMLHVTGAAYEQVRSHPARFLVAPEHVVAEIERPVEQHEGYWVIEKEGAGRDEVERLDIHR